MLRQTSTIILVLLATLATNAQAAFVTLQLSGVKDGLRDAVLAGVEINQYVGREISEAQAQRLYERAADQVRSALEPYGYYNPKVTGELRGKGGDFVAVLEVDPGEPVTVSESTVAVDGDAIDQREVKRAISGFTPTKGQVFDHASYERSKATVSASLFGTGYLDAMLERHRVEVSRSSNNAAIDLKWKAGQRYKLGPTHFDGGQFSDQFMQRYIPWREGDFYSQTELLTFQQRLVDADYFSVAQVQPDTEHAADGVVPISVILAPAKRTIYAGGVFIGTDTGVGVRGGVERRWINKRGHKLKFETILAQRLKTLSTLYQIPLPGQDNHTWNFGVTYRDENTDTSQSKTFKIAANDSKVWKGWTRTWGLQFLTGDFKVADVKGKTMLLYPEVSLSRKAADDFNFPRKGHSLTLAARAGQKGLLSDTSFAQVTADAKWIRGLGDNGRFIARSSLGYTQVGDFDKLPPELRFFAGGDRSIRGYSFQTVGPRYPLDATLGANKVFGGKELVVASGEYEHYFNQTWGGAVFVDAGDAFTGSNFKLKVGTGVGLRWRSPVGMVRVDLGVPLRDKNAGGVELHIVIGPDL